MSNKSNKRATPGRRARIIEQEDSSASDRDDDGEMDQNESGVSSGRRGRSGHCGPASSQKSSSTSTPASSQQRSRSTRTSNSSQGRPTPTTKRRAVESDSESSDDGEKAGGRRNQKSKESPTKKSAARSKKVAEQNAKVERRARAQEMINQGVLYIIMANSKKVPIKRADFNRIVCHGEARLTRKVISKVQDIVDKIFGIDVYALNENTLEYDTDVLVQGRSCFMVVSQFQALGTVKNQRVLDQREETIRATLFITLNLIFMQNMENGVSESQLWTAMSRLGFAQILKVLEKDFGKFMKTEYVSTYYLRSQETKDEHSGTVNHRYMWGPRAHLEFRKLGVFMNALTTGNLRASDFPKQMQMVLDDDDDENAAGILEAWDKNFEEEVGPEESSDDDVSSASGDDDMTIFTETTLINSVTPKPGSTKRNIPEESHPAQLSDSEVSHQEEMDVDEGDETTEDD